MYNNQSLLSNNTTSGSPKLSLVNISDATRGYMFKLTAKALVEDVQYYRITCFNPNSTLTAVGDNSGEYGGNILTTVSWGDIWSSGNQSKSTTESGDGNEYTAEQWDGRDFKYGSQWCFESDDAGGYYIKSRGVGSTRPYVSSSGVMTDADSKASFKFYSLVAKDKATLNFNSSGVATIDLSTVDVSGSTLSYDPSTGVVTSTGTSGTIFVSFDNVNFSGVKNISVNIAGDPYTDICNTGDVINASGVSINGGAWYGSRYGMNFTDNHRANAGQITTLKWNVNASGSMKINSITITANAMIVTDARDTPIASLPHYSVSSDGTVSLGSSISTNYGNEIDASLGDGSGKMDEYIDIADYDELRIYTSNANQRVFFFNHNPITSSTSTTESAQAFLDNRNGNSQVSFAHNATEGYYYAKVSDIKEVYNEQAKIVGVKAAYGSTAIVNKIQVYQPNSKYSIIISGQYSSDVDLSAISSDATTTAIDCSGLTGNGVSLTSGNPNCLFFANAGVLSNTQNVIVDGTCANLVLADNHPFKAPSDFTATAATYTTTINTTAKAGTLCLPFAATIPDGVTAYTLAYTSGNEATATPVSGTIDANTPVLLNGNGSATFTGVNVAIVADAANTEGAMTGVFEQGYVPQNSYVLQNQTGGLGFYKVAVEETITIKPFRAYLTAQNAGARLSIKFVDNDEPTGIENLTPALSESEGAVYDLQGRRVEKATKGLYIKNGKKVIIK